MPHRSFLEASFFLRARTVTSDFSLLITEARSHSSFPIPKLPLQSFVNPKPLNNHCLAYFSNHSQIPPLLGAPAELPDCVLHWSSANWAADCHLPEICPPRFTPCTQTLSNKLLVKPRSASSPAQGYSWDLRNACFTLPWKGALYWIYTQGGNIDEGLPSLTMLQGWQQQKTLINPRVQTQVYILAIWQSIMLRAVQTTVAATTQCTNKSWMDLQ